MMQQPVRFIDTSVFLRILLRDDEEKSKRALALMLAAEHGETRVATSVLVIFETIFTLQRRHGVDRRRIQAMVLPIVNLRNVQLPEKALIRRALDLYVAHRVAFADAYNAAEMEARGITEIYAWDAHYARLPGVTVLEPGNA